MCIIILNPAKAKAIDKETFLTCWERNPHGGGIAYTTPGGTTTIIKEMERPETLYASYRKARSRYPKANILLHFRITTHGDTNLTNCHPFRVDEDLVFAHNGIIHIDCLPGLSDTNTFNEQELKTAKKGFHRSAPTRAKIKDRIGRGSKIVFLDSSNRYYIINEEAGQWNGGSWFSNGSFTKWEPRKLHFIEPAKPRQARYSVPVTPSSSLFDDDYRYIKPRRSTEECQNCSIQLSSHQERSVQHCESCARIFGLLPELD